MYILGGGPSLCGFDFEQLRGRNVIGCNSAFLPLGVGIVPITFFSDKKWHDTFHKPIAQYVAAGGEVFTQCEALVAYSDYPYLKILKRRPRGLHNDAIGFNGNSGCSAVNLALILGAQRVLLLGFDCRPPAINGRSHWHDCRIEAPKAEVYRNFMKGWADISVQLPKSYPGCEIINLGPDSEIPFFPKREFKEVNAA